MLVVGTSELRTARLTDQLAIEVDGQRVEETASEKLLGMVVNNRLSWKEHLHGDQENTSMISQLKQRLLKYMSQKKLKMILTFIFGGAPALLILAVKNTNRETSFNILLSQWIAVD